MNAPTCGVFAFGGGPLVGDRLVRVIYVDETGHDARQRRCVVAGVIIDPDRQWRTLSVSIEALKENVPPEFRPGFIFHATDLFNGGKYRGCWEAQERWSLLESLVALPRKLSIPLVFGFVTKPKQRDKPRSCGRI